MPKRKAEGTSIELKKLSIYERMSEETTAFVAEIYVDGVNAGHAKNDGHGGSTYYHAYPEHRNLIEQAEKHCLELPPLVYPASHGMEEFSIKMNLEHFIDDLVQKELEKRDRKKFEKKMTNHIMWGVPNGNSYRQVKFRVTFTPTNAPQIQKYINERVKPNLKEGEVILNTNLQQLGVIL